MFAISKAADLNQFSTRSAVPSLPLRKGFPGRALDNEGKSAASFCHQVAAWFPDMFCNFYLVKNHKITKTQQPLKLEKKISTYLESLEFQKFFDVCQTKFNNNIILLNKISHRCLLTTTLFTERKSLINHEIKILVSLSWPEATALWVEHLTIDRKIKGLNPTGKNDRKKRK